MAKTDKKDKIIETTINNEVISTVDQQQEIIDKALENTFDSETEAKSALDIELKDALKAEEQAKEQKKEKIEITKEKNTKTIQSQVQKSIIRCTSGRRRK